MRVGVGIGEAAFAAPAFALIGDYVPLRRRAFAIAVLGTGSYLGQVLGLALGPLIEAGHGWHAAFIWTGAAGLIIAPIFYLTVPEIVRPHLIDRVDDHPRLSFLPVFRSLIALAPYRLLVMGGAGGAFSGYAFGIWGPTFTRVLRMPLAQANLTFGLAFGGSAMLGALGSGWICDRLRMHNPASPLKLSAGTMIIANLAILSDCLTTDISAAVTLTIIAGVFNGGWTVGLLNTIQDQIDATFRATAIAVFSLALTFVGLVGGPTLVGILSDQMHVLGTKFLRFALLPVTFGGLVGGILLILASRSTGIHAQAANLP
jgi:predicted MFS family arabinose efflux permease